MPTYEYECSAGHRYEKREGFDAPATQRCAGCRRLARRVLHAPPIVFKGSGFYVTDSRKPAPAVESGAKAEPTTPASDGKTSEAAPAAKDATKDAVAPPEADRAAAAG